MISEYLDKNNLHHAYLIEGAGDEILPEIFRFIEALGVKTVGNPDFNHLSIDLMKIKQALELRSMSTVKGFSNSKKIFVININRFTPDAQGVLLKMFEEPIQNTHFFLITPDANVLTKTLLSRFYLIKTEINFSEELKEANKFIAASLKDRIDFVKEFVTVSEDEESEIIETNSVRSRAFKFLNALEYVLHQKLISKKLLNKEVDFFEQIFKAREYLRQQGSPTKTLMESVAIAIPVL